MMLPRSSTKAWFVVVTLGAAVVGGCKTKAGTGAVAGGAGGAAVGAIIGHQSGHTAGGALIGGAVGAIGGGLVGHGMDKKDQEKREREEEAALRQRDGSRSTVYNDRDAIGMGDVIAWTNRGVKEDVVIDRIERSSTIFKLTAADENHLRDAGVSERVIRTMKGTARR